MSVQSSINSVINTVGVGIGITKKLAEDSAKKSIPTDAKVKESGIDAKMAAKARRMAQQKINAIYENKELSNKARTRRMGLVIDEYNKTLGGSK